MRTFSKSSKLDNVCYDIRGPVMDEANEMIAKGEKIFKLNIGNPAPFAFNAPDEIIQAMTDNLPVLHAMAKALMEVETINHTQVENLFKYHSIYAPGEEPKKDDTDSSDSPLPPAPSDDSSLPPVFGE